ncbi:MAG: sigma-70 family RNA polymerase sigma factor [Cyanobacteria bacterium P01_F01_bin.56]
MGAYLQEAAYWAAHKFSQFQLSHSSLSDRFQIAFTQFESCLNQFAPDRGSRLESFARLFFTSTITNELRRTQELDLCSDWMLLRKTSLKRFVESLHSMGLDDSATERYRLAWTCFKHLYAPQVSGARQLPPPDQDTWKKIAQLYNCERLNRLPAAASAATAEQLEEWLKEVIGWLRRYLQPSVKSLNTPIPGGETRELQDMLQSQELAPMDELLQKLEQSSQKAQQVHLRQFLRGHLNTLSNSEQEILQLYYGNHLSQQQIAKQLKTKQYSVCRQLIRIRKKILKAVMAWSQDTESVNFSSDKIEQIAEILEIWLQEFWDFSDSSSA